MSRAQSQEHKVLEATRIDDEPTLPNGAPEPSTRCPLREASLRETISRLNSSILIEERLKPLQRKKSGLEEKIVTLGRDRARLELDIPCYEQMLAVDTTEDLLLPLTKSSLKKFLSELSTIIGRDVSAFVSCERAPQSTIDEWIRKDYTPQIGQNLLVIHEIDKNPENRARVHRAKQYHGERNTELEKLGEALNGSILFLGETNNPTPLPEDSLQQAKILLRSFQDPASHWNSAAATSHTRTQEAKKAAQRQLGVVIQQTAQAKEQLEKIMPKYVTLENEQENAAPIQRFIPNTEMARDLLRKAKCLMEQGLPTRGQFHWAKCQNALQGKYRYGVAFRNLPILRVEESGELSAFMSPSLTSPGKWVPVTIGHLRSCGLTSKTRLPPLAALAMNEALGFVQPGSCVDFFGFPLGRQLSNAFANQDLQPKRKLKELTGEDRPIHQPAQGEGTSKTPRTWGHTFLEQLQPDRVITGTALGTPKVRWAVFVFGDKLVAEASRTEHSTLVFSLNEAEQKVGDITQSRAWKAMQHFAQSVTAVKEKAQNSGSFVGEARHLMTKTDQLENSLWAKRLRALLS